MVSDLGQIEKRLERMKKDLKKMKTPELEKENELLIKAKASVETEKPLREMEMTQGGQEAHPRLHVSEREADALRAQYRREHATRQGPGSGGRKI